MALTAALAFTSVSADGTTSLLTDGTVYGGANPARAAVAVYLTAYKTDVDLVETAQTLATFDPEVATTFTLTNGTDGRYTFYFIIINNWNGGTTYAQYDLAWDTTQNAFYQYIFATPTSGHAVTDVNYWTPVTDPTSKIADIGTSTAPTNIAAYQVLEKIIDYQTAKCYGNVAILAAKDSCADDCDCSSGLCKSRNRIRTLLSVMRLSDTRQQYLQGERAAREAEKYCDDCGCLQQ